MNELIWHFLYFAELDLWLGDTSFADNHNRPNIEEAYAIFFCY